MRHVLAVFALGALILALAGCGSGEQDASQARAQDKYCSSLKDLGADVEAFFTLDRDDRQAAIDAFEDDWDEWLSEAEDLDAINTTTLDDAWDDFTSALEDDDASFSDQLSAAGDFASVVWATYTPDCLGS